MSVPERQARFGDLLERSHACWAGIARAYATMSDRDDLLQEIALQVWKNLDQFTGRSSLDTWAYRVALNTALAWRRKANLLWWLTFPAFLMEQHANFVKGVASCLVQSPCINRCF